MPIHLEKANEKCSITKDAFNEYNQWFTSDLKLVARIQELIRDIDRNPFKGLGKP